jgi:hypothetical protein
MEHSQRKAFEEKVLNEVAGEDVSRRNISDR